MDQRLGLLRPVLCTLSLAEKATFSASLQHEPRAPSHATKCNCIWRTTSRRGNGEVVRSSGRVQEGASLALDRHMMQYR